MGNMSICTNPTFEKLRNGKTYTWFQLSGHVDSFKPGTREGYILKLKSDIESSCFEKLKNDTLKSYVPHIAGVLYDHTDCKQYMIMQDLLYDFDNPAIMDIKIGTRSFLEDECSNNELRNDLYMKIMCISPDDLTDEEHHVKAITKRRYMTWREQSTCSSTLGFRIEAIKVSLARCVHMRVYVLNMIVFCHTTKETRVINDFFMVKDKDVILNHFKKFTNNDKNLQVLTCFFDIIFIRPTKLFLKKLRKLHDDLLKSPFFKSHELIGSSVLFIHDQANLNIFLIDFAKTRQLPNNVQITHVDDWIHGNHEDGYLIGIKNLIQIFQSMTADNTVYRIKN